MFKWDLPVRKGTEVFPDVTKPPMAVRTSIVIQGPVSGDEEGDYLQEAGRLFSNAYGSISTFIQGQRANYSLGVTEYQKVRHPFPGGQITLSNNMGQEIAEIVLFPKLPSEDPTGGIAIILQFNPYIDSNPKFRLRWGNQVFPSEGYYEYETNRPPAGLDNGGIITDLVDKNAMLTYGGYIAEGLSAADHDEATGPFGVGTMILNLARIIKKPQSDVHLVLEIYKDLESKRRVSTTAPTGTLVYVDYQYLGAAWYEGIYWITGENCWGPYGDIGFASSPKEYKVNTQSPVIRVNSPSGYPTPVNGRFTLAEVSAYGVSYSYENEPPPADWRRVGTASTAEQYVDEQWIIKGILGDSEDVVDYVDRGDWGVSISLLPDYSDIRLSWFGDNAAAFTFEHGTYWWDRGWPEEQYTAATWTLEQEAMFVTSFNMDTAASGLVVEHEMTIPKDYWRKNLRGLKG